MTAARTPARFRRSRAMLIPVVLLFLCVLPIASAAPWTLVFLLVPALVVGWVLRTGVDVDAAGVTGRTLFGSRQVPWTEIAGIRIGERNELYLVTTRGTDVALPVLRTRDLPTLSRVSEGRIAEP